MKETRWDTVRKERMELAVAAAKKLFLTCKIENVKMTQIAEETGIGVASLYRYFETKEAIAIAVATELWGDLKEMVVPVLTSPEYEEKEGLGQLSTILDIYSDLLRKKKDFLLFLSDFDSFCLKQGISKEQLMNYENSIQDFYLPYRNALEKGKKDGTVILRSDPKILYLTINHTMLALLEKIAAGEILSQDQYGAEEIDVMKEIILNYYQAR